jgi:hypothetical protein
MEKEFVTYELALMLKQLGFDEPCFGYYESEEKILIINFNNLPLTEEQNKRPGLYRVDNRNGILPQWAVAAPTFQQVFKWFREKYDLHSEIVRDNNKLYVFSITKSDDIYPVFLDFSDGRLHEDAELNCIKKLCKIIEKN